MCRFALSTTVQAPQDPVETQMDYIYKERKKYKPNIKIFMLNDT